MFLIRSLALSLCLAITAFTAFTADLQPVETTPKLENLNSQIKANAEDAQAYANRGYTLALLGRKEEACADIRKSAPLKDTGPSRCR